MCGVCGILCDAVWCVVLFCVIVVSVCVFFHVFVGVVRDVLCGDVWCGFVCCVCLSVPCLKKCVVCDWLCDVVWFCCL